MPKLNFAHVCENAFLSRDSKVNIIGDFDQIVTTKKISPEDPLLYRFYVVTNFSVESEKKYTQEIFLINTANNNEIIGKKIEQNSGKDGKIGLILNLDAKFSEAGLYKIVIKLDCVLYNEIQLKVLDEQHPKEHA